MKKSRSFSKSSYSTLNKGILNHIVSYSTVKSSSYKPTKITQNLYQRLKQNQINTKFNQRRSKLKTIYQENKEIYVKIMTKKSSYNKKQLNKSSSSLNSSIRSSRSNSQHDKSIRSIKTKKSHTEKVNKAISLKTFKPKQPKPKINFVKVNINQLQNDKIQELKTLFSKTFKSNSGKQNLPSLSKRHFTERVDLASIKERQTPIYKVPRSMMSSTTNSRIKIGVRQPKLYDNNLFLI